MTSFHPSSNTSKVTSKMPLILQKWLFACFTILNQSNNNPQQQTWWNAEHCLISIQHWENTTSSRSNHEKEYVCLTNYAVWHDCKLVQRANKQLNEMERSSDKIHFQICWHCYDALYFANKPSLQDITRFYHIQTERWYRHSSRGHSYISLLIIPCMIVYVTNNKEPFSSKSGLYRLHTGLYLLQSLQCNQRNTVWPIQLYRSLI